METGNLLSSKEKLLEAKLHNRPYITNYFPPIPHKYRGVVPSKQFLQKKQFVKGETEKIEIINTKEEESKEEDENEGEETKAFYSRVTSEPSSSSNRKRSRKDSKMQLVVRNSYFCDSCKEEIPGAIPLETHVRSVVHLFSENVAPSKSYFLNESNVGYRMLKNNYNWSEELGLGAQNQGQLDPVPTQLKSDRKGLGSGVKEREKRVTHFEAGDTDAVKSRKKTNGPSQPKKKLKHLLQQQKEREQRIREEIFNVQNF